jgi:hypothetical protein
MGKLEGTLADSDLTVSTPTPILPLFYPKKRLLCHSSTSYNYQQGIGNAVFVLPCHFPADDNN